MNVKDALLKTLAGSGEEYISGAALAENWESAGMPSGRL